MKKLFYVPIIWLIALGSCQGNISNPDFVKAGFGADSDSVKQVDSNDMYEDKLLIQLPASIVDKIENDRRLRYMELNNIIKYKVQDTQVYDLTFISYGGNRTKSVKFDQKGNKIYH
ncbi:hypothetical protein KIH41_11740 [Litoribacter ruber]|uniref:Uncharacterized protein n=1 Tax=Litoribacter ruber TaxID=702568 RepID=A0AAP2G5T0_9BACT|nr:MULTISPECIES: hypothetical protein [Litoribacter]MBS9524888.1 hypothetical protein [Litoribacter alkaliphilus]MBT0811951.1 hypothetical protein [Litoribacter ruber]